MIGLHTCIAYSAVWSVFFPWENRVYPFCDIASSPWDHCHGLWAFTVQHRAMIDLLPSGYTMHTETSDKFVPVFLHISLSHPLTGSALFPLHISHGMDFYAELWTRGERGRACACVMVVAWVCERERERESSSISDAYFSGESQRPKRDSMDL